MVYNNPCLQKLEIPGRQEAQIPSHTHHMLARKTTSAMKKAKLQENTA